MSARLSKEQFFSLPLEERQRLLDAVRAHRPVGGVATEHTVKPNYSNNSRRAYDAVGEFEETPAMLQYINRKKEKERAKSATEAKP